MKLFAGSLERVLKKVEKLAHKEAMRIHKTGILKNSEEVKISRDDWQEEKVSYYIVAHNPKKFFETGNGQEVRMTSDFSFKKYPAEWREAVLQTYEEVFEEDLLGYKMLGGLAVLKYEG